MVLHRLRHFSTVFAVAALIGAVDVTAAAAHGRHAGGPFTPIAVTHRASAGTGAVAATPISELLRA